MADLKYKSMETPKSQQEQQSDGLTFTYDNRSQGQALHQEFHHGVRPNHPTVFSILQDEDLKPMVEEAGVYKMFEADLGAGKKLGNSRAMVDALNKVEGQVKSLLRNRSQGLSTDRATEYATKREALGIITRSICKGLDEYQKTTGQSLPAFHLRKEG